MCMGGGGGFAEGAWYHNNMGHKVQAADVNYEQEQDAALAPAHAHTWTRSRGE